MPSREPDASQPRDGDDETRPPHVPERTPPAGADAGEQHLECPICHTELYGRHCKLICPNCGYCEDCSDMFPP